MRTMRCQTCKGIIQFADGEWRHLGDTKCAAVVVEWPDRPLVEDDEAA